MKPIHPAIKWIVPLIIVLTLVATIAGLWPAEGTSYTLASFRGEQVTINARGLYYWDTVSSAAQMQANDLVTLVLGLSLLIVSFWLALRDPRKGFALQGRLLLTGTLAFILYTYITMCFGADYNRLFLVYVALFSLSLFGVIICMLSFDLSTLPGYFSEKLPRGWIAGLLLFAAAFLTLAWLGRIASTLFQNAIPNLENTTSMFIQVMDLGVIVPMCVLGGVLLLKRHPLGYLLSSVGMMKFLTMGIAVSLMGLNMQRVGVPVSIVEVVVFIIITVINIVMTVILLKNINPLEAAPG